MRANGETAVILSADSVVEANKLKKQWEDMWCLGHAPTPEEIAEYKTIYNVAKNQRKKIVDIGASPPEPEPNAPIENDHSYNGNPASAHIAWLEAGSPSAGGRDLEFPKAIIPFFGLKNGKEDRVFRMNNGQRFTLTFTERLDNQMWRLLFNSASIQAAIGRDTMRPASGKNRSDLAVCFRKIPGSKNYELSMLKIGSSEYNEMTRKSEKVNGLFSTRNPGGRKFGFF